MNANAAATDNTELTNERIDVCAYGGVVRIAGTKREPSVRRNVSSGSIMREAFGAKVDVTRTSPESN
jgi:hypothetical protein